MEQTASKDEKAKHTPGDWSVLPEKLNDGQHIAGRCPEVVCGKTLIARVNRFGQNPGDPIGDANARLISASPDLLEACKMSEAWRIHCCRETISEADQRAFCEQWQVPMNVHPDNYVREFRAAAIAKATGGVA